MKTQSLQPNLIGVDLIEMKKIKAFYRLHRDRLSSFLKPYEMNLVRRSLSPERTLAEILAATESLYKAGSRGKRRSGFENIRLTPALLKEKILFIKNKRFVVALVKPCAGK